MDNKEGVIDLVLVPAIRDYEARVNVTWANQNGDLPDPVAYDTPDNTLKAMVAEAIRAGSIPGLRADANVDLTDFKVDRFPPNEQRPFNLVQIRPKTAFGA
jgi:hypothetical protein